MRFPFRFVPGRGAFLQEVGHGLAGKPRFCAGPEIRREDVKLLFTNADQQKTVVIFEGTDNLVISVFWTEPQF
jgi:hypothetical protein